LETLPHRASVKINRVERLERNWAKKSVMPARGFTCGHCGHYMSSDQGFGVEEPRQVVLEPYIYICSHCVRPTFFAIFDGRVIEQVPGVAFGNPVENVPESVAELYDEARRCMSVSAFTSAVLGCRKLLMNIAVAEGAEEGKNFVAYIEYLADKGFIPPGGKGWVDHIRQQGNEATHEISMKTEADAKDLISFAEMLLKFIYEFPARVPSASTVSEQP
jgi:Domain of unknown function (DUF4145)